MRGQPAEYLAFGVDEYWIFDSTRQNLTSMTRWRGQWKQQTLKPTQKLSTRLLPNFSLDLKRVLAAAK